MTRVALRQAPHGEDARERAAAVRETERLSSGNAAITPKAGTASLSTNKPDLEIKFSAEGWQFFAFVFTALASIGFELIDEIPLEYWLSWRPRWPAKSLLFGLLGYLLLFNWRVKTRVIRMLRWITTKHF